jgi:hypothetical protein
MATGHVAELAEIDLEDLDSTRGERLFSIDGQGGRKVAARRKMIERHPLEALYLMERLRQRGSA